MGRKRSRKADSDDSDGDSDFETIVVDTNQRYGLRPRKAQLFTEDLIDEEEAEYTSDFEDELNDRGKRSLKTVSYSCNNSSEEQEVAAQTDSVDYDEVIVAGIVVNENHIDFEKVIEKTEIQIHKRNVERTPSPSENTPKKRSRKPKWTTEKATAGNGEFCHFLDTRDSIAEDIPNFAIGESLDSIEPSELVASVLDTEYSEQGNAETDAKQNEPATTDDVNNVVAVARNDCSEDCASSEKATDIQEIEGDVANGNVTHTESIETQSSANSTEANADSKVPEAVGDGGNEEVIQIPDDEDSNPKDNSHNWNSIIQAMDDKSYFIECDNEVAVLKEKLPKARFHYILVPRHNIRSLAELSTRHVPMVKHLYETANRIKHYPEHNGCNFNIGFNAQPTMFIYNQKFLWLHLHVVSDDMISEDLLLKKHWNAIHSKLFVHPEVVIDELDEHGQMISLPTMDECREILNGDIKCHKCDFVTPKFSAIKKHVRKEHAS